MQSDCRYKSICTRYGRKVDSFEKDANLLKAGLKCVLDEARNFRLIQMYDNESYTELVVAELQKEDLAGLGNFIIQEPFGYLQHHSWAIQNYQLKN